ncbi:MAG: carbohydrate ABC transporter permease [Clostridia bacterium]|nr:carbohydrate ABC transporter permease [Clostridia bacterium]
MAKNKIKKMREPINWKKELKLLPGYIIITLWVVFTAVVLIWILAASLSTSKEIYSGAVLEFKSGFHFENYSNAWNAQNVSVFFANSLLYATVSCIGIILISAPAAYVLSRFTFLGNKTIKSSLIVAMSIPSIMVILPVFSQATAWHITGTRWLLIILYICLNVPFTTTFLLNFFGTLSRTYEEAAAIDGCSPMKTFWVIMLPLAQPGLITVGIFNFLAVWNEYFVAMVFASSDKLKSVGYGLFSLVAAMRSTGDLGGLFAAVVIVFLPTFILYIFMSEKIIAGVTGGGIKG